MVQKLSTFLGTSFTEASLDSAGVRSIVQSETIKLDSGTSGNYIKTLTGGDGFTITAAGHALDATILMDSNHLVHRTGTQTLLNKTLNLTNNTIIGTLGQFNASLTGDDFVGLNASQTLTNKTLTSPTITQPSITGPASITDVTTFGLRDVTTTTYETRIRSNNASPVLTADRTLTLDVNNADRTISLTGNLTLGGSLTTSGAHNTTLTTSGTTTLTLPTSGTVISKDGSGNFTIAGTMTGEVNRSASTSVVAGQYGSATAIPVITVDSNGFVDAVSTASVSGVSGVSYNTSTGVLTVQTAIENFEDSITLAPFTTSTLAEGTNQYFTQARARAAFSVQDNGGFGSLSYTQGTGTVEYTGPSVSDVRSTLQDGTGINFDSASGKINIANTGVTAATYGSASLVPVIAINAQGQITSASTVSVAGVSTFTFDSATATLNIGTADGGSYNARIGLLNFTTADLTENTNLYYTAARADSAIDARVTKSFVDNLNVDADTLDGQNGTYYRIDVYDASGTLLN
jgi:hypothetical protein